ncbi:hypothetical protein EJ05DRAFT_539457 [Pseudovirgaria hyperparasitica]|uniref:AB hydrolase-1 domain-containing protein n=1 Tax=Pseudovirgaria hyperparasitica TaxID=470096 RepID=A0A6A6W4L7_9PEZI|nr:uncharacterized protein EJ05DRAFT_539457 [Pseudovirgaria hyperparasitica]KAF2756507.1 hypothetical protein EJ05DRAFT_539457 [Pseudovirgaria hyperparasitica]
MSAHLFDVKEHKVAGCHIREYPGSTVDQEDVLYLHVKQYVPHEAQTPRSPTTNPARDAVTFIAAHAGGMPKEVYEPLWDEMLLRSKEHGFAIRGIWIADVSNHGMSGVLNEGKNSTDYSWMDHVRDLLLVVNEFRHEMPRPLVGIGHSFGGNQIVNLALIHPRLFTTLLLLDPVLQHRQPYMGFACTPPGVTNWALHKPDLFPSRSAAIATLSTQPPFTRLDPRVLTLYLAHALRPLPTPLYPSIPAALASLGLADTHYSPHDPPVTYTTTRTSELLTLNRQNFAAAKGRWNRTTHPDLDLLSNGWAGSPDRITHPDPDTPPPIFPMYRPEAGLTHARLPQLRPSAFFLLGRRTWLALDELRAGIASCGTGVGGSGGVGAGRVESVVLEGQGHFFPLEVVGECAGRCAGWVGREMERWRGEERAWVEGRKGVDHGRLEGEWFEVIRPPGSFGRGAKGGAKM